MFDTITTTLKNNIQYLFVQFCNYKCVYNSIESNIHHSLHIAIDNFDYPHIEIGDYLPVHIETDDYLPIYIDADDYFPVHVDTDDFLPVHNDADDYFPVHIDTDDFLPIYLDIENLFLVYFDSDDYLPIETDIDDFYSIEIEICKNDLVDIYFHFLVESYILTQSFCIRFEGDIVLFDCCLFQTILLSVLFDMCTTLI